MDPRIVIAGGNGLIGLELAKRLLQKGYRVIIVSRRPSDRFKHELPGVEYCSWNLPELTRAMEGVYGVVNLAGASIARFPWTRNYQETILKSRVMSGQKIFEAIQNSNMKPQVLIQASAVGFYGTNPESECSEISPKGNGFLASVCNAWEESTLAVEKLNIRRVIIRTGIVLSKNGGFLPNLIFSFKAFLGGHFGSGNQILPWIHMDDEVEAICFLIEQTGQKGVYNLTSPNSCSHKEFCKLLGRQLNRPSWLHIPAFALQLFAGTFAREVLLSGQNAIPPRLEQEGFSFNYPQIEGALTNLLNNKMS